MASKEENKIKGKIREHIGLVIGGVRGTSGGDGCTGRFVNLLLA